MFEFLAFSPFYWYLTFPDWTTSSKDMVFWNWAPPLFSPNFQKIKTLYLGNRSSDQRKILGLRFGGQSQHVCQISLKSERVGFRIVFLFGWVDMERPQMKWAKEYSAQCHSQKIQNPKSKPFFHCRLKDLPSLEGLNQSCRVGGKISNSDLSKIFDSDSSTQREWNLAVKINGNCGAQQEITFSTKFSKEIVPFQQEIPI